MLQPVSNDALTVRSLTEGDRQWAALVLEELWPSRIALSPDMECSDEADIQPKDLDGLIALQTVSGVADPVPTGLLTFKVFGSRLVIATHDVLEPHRGIGRAMLNELAYRASIMNITMLELAVRNDALGPLAFYQKCGFRLVRLDSGFWTPERCKSYEVDAQGHDDIPVRDRLILRRDIPRT